MKVGIISVHVDYHRKGGKNRVALQPQIGPLIAGLLPSNVDVELVNGTWEDPDWDADYDLLFISSMHSDFDHARQISHYWRRRGVRTVYGGAFASAYPNLCQPFFDTVAVGDPESTVPRIYRDYVRGELRPRYVSEPWDPRRAPTPRFDLMLGRSVLPLCLEATRGCPFSCEFCVLTGLGTRYHTRPVEDVIGMIRAGQEMLRGRTPAFKTRIVGFCDNNIGGSLPYLRDLCAALKRIKVQWYGATTFNVIANPALVRMMSEAGCRALFVGLESFNAATIKAMRKRQNVIRNIRAAISSCLDHGILIVSGLMLSPTSDDLDYVRSIPAHLSACGLHMPTFICFETPIPGTPHFRQLARSAQPAFLPGALLRDFTGYTLVVRPRHSSAEAFVDAYRHLLSEVYCKGNRARKLAHDLPRLAARGRWLPAVIDAGDVLTIDPIPGADRTLLAGTDSAPSERVPLTEADFDSESQRRLILEPWQVTDGSGRALDSWDNPLAPFAQPQPRTESPARARHASSVALGGTLID